MKEQCTFTESVDDKTAPRESRNAVRLWCFSLYKTTQVTELVTILHKEPESGSTSVLACAPQAFLPQCTVYYRGNVLAPVGLFFRYLSGHLRYVRVKKKPFTGLYAM